MFRIILGGIFLGSIIFMFSFVASKKNGKYYLAPIITFLFSIAITAFGFIVIGGFQGMAYGFLASGFLIVSIVGTLLLPLLMRGKNSQQFKKRDRVTLVTLPIIFFATIGLVIYLDQGYWIIDKGTEISLAEEESHYKVSTISEGKKKVVLTLGNEYSGKEIEVESISKWGSTKITVKIIKGEDENKSPYIEIGLDEINKPLKVQTTNGVVFESVMNSQ